MVIKTHNSSLFTSKFNDETIFFMTKEEHLENLLTFSRCAKDNLDQVCTDFEHTPESQLYYDLALKEFNYALSFAVKCVKYLSEVANGNS